MNDLSEPENLDQDDSEDAAMQRAFAKHLKNVHGATAYFGLHFSGEGPSTYIVERKDGTLRIHHGGHTSLTEVIQTLERLTTGP